MAGSGEQVMSYTTRCTFNVSGTVSYPASEHGGRTSYSDSVSVDITVDTTPFDASVLTCSRNVGELAVATGNAARDIVESKAVSANRISDSLIKGFTSLIVNEVRQKMVELAAKIPAKLQELKALAANCLAKHEQMTKDYERITGRYSKLFGSLDQNLHAALQELDRPVFSITSSAGNVIFTGGVLNSYVAEGAFAGGEQVSDAAMLQIAGLKQSAERVIAVTGRNIAYNRELDSKIADMVSDGDCPSMRKVFVPAVVMASSDGEVFCDIPAECPDADEVKQGVSRQVLDIPMTSLSRTSADNIDVFLRKNLSSFVEESGNSESGGRIAGNVLRMWNSIRGSLACES